MLRSTTLFSGCLVVVAACADHLPEAARSRDLCHTEYLTPGEQLRIVPPEKAPVLDFAKSLRHYDYPDDLRRQRLEGRALVRLKLASTGKVDSAELLRVDAPRPVAAAMCTMLAQVRYDVPESLFPTADSRTFVLGVRYCLGNCNRVPVYPGFEKHEITITGHPPPER